MTYKLVGHTADGTPYLLEDCELGNEGKEVIYTSLQEAEQVKETIESCFMKGFKVTIVPLAD